MSSSTVPSREALLALNRSATAARLLSGAVHEVNNALQVISGTVELLQGRTDLPEPVVRSLERVRNQSTRAATALADVLVFTKGAIDEWTRVDLRDTVSYCLGVRRFAITRAGLNVRFEPDENAVYVVSGIRALLQQAIVNLIINAELALAERRGGTIDVTLDGDARWVQVRVSDEGAGVQIDQPERAFEAFVSTRDPWQGAGLGLWAARTVAESHGGTVGVENSVRGARFTLRLPRSA